MKLKRIQSALLTLDNGEVKHLERIGRGRFSIAWRNGEAAYVQTHEDDNAKELLCHLRGTPHLPAVEHIGDMGIYRWYKMPLYEKLTAKHKRAWADYRHLQQLRLDAANGAPKSVWGARYPAREVNELFADMVESDDTLTMSERYGDTIRDLVNWCGSYGEEWLIEPLQTRNCVVDSDGELILLDPVFDMRIIREQQEQRAKKARW